MVLRNNNTSLNGLAFRLPVKAGPDYNERSAKERTAIDRWLRFHRQRGSGLISITGEPGEAGDYGRDCVVVTVMTKVDGVTNEYAVIV